MFKILNISILAAMGVSGAAAQDGGTVPVAPTLQDMAEAGNAEVLAGFGAICAEGRGVPRDDAKALAYYCRVARRGNHAGQAGLAMLHQ